MDGFHRLRSLVVFAWAGWFCAPLAAAAPLEVLLERARLAPPELASHTLLAAAGPAMAPDPDRAKALLEEAYQLAANAQEPMRWRWLTQAAAPFAVDAWFPLGLDTVSLQSQAVRRMQALDPARARELLARIEPPPMVRTHCQQQRVADFHTYWEALEATAPLDLLGKRISNLAWIADIEHAAQLISRREGLPSERRLLAGALANAIREISPDPRAFTSSSVRNSFSLRAAIVRLRQDGSEEAAHDLLAAYRGLVIRQLNEYRCSDAEIEPVPGLISFSQGAVEIEIQRFNGLLLLFPRTDLQPVTRSEITKGIDIGATDPYEIWNSAETAKLDHDIIELNIGYPDADRSAPQWQAEAARVLAALEAWNGEEAPSSQMFFERKCDLFLQFLHAGRAVTLRGPAGVTRWFGREALPRPARGEVIGKLVKFLTGDAAGKVRENNRLGWYAQVIRLIEDARLSECPAKTTENTVPSVYDEVIAAYEGSGDAAMRLSVLLADLRPGPECAISGAAPGRSL